MTKLMKNFLVVFFFMICSIFAEVKIPHEIITENPSREVKIVESKKLKEKAEMNITVKKLTPLEIDGGITSSNGKYVIDTGKYDVKELDKDNFLVVKDLNELKKGIDIDGNFLRENIQSQINFDVEILDNKIFLNIENLEDVYVAIVYQSKIVKIFHCNPITSINTIDAKLNITKAKVESKNNFIISKNTLELDKNIKGIDVENKIPSTNLLRSRRSIEEEKLVDSMKITTGENSVFVKGLEYTENPNYDIQLKNNGKDFVLTKKNDNKLNENIVIEYYSNNVQIGELKLAILNGNVTIDLGEIIYRIDGRLRGINANFPTSSGRYDLISPNVLNDFKWISKKDINTSIDGIKEAVLQKKSNGTIYEFPGMMEYDIRNYDSSKSAEKITSIEVIGQTAENVVDSLTEYTTPNGNVALKKDVSTIEELVNSIKLGINSSTTENNQTVKVVINNTYTLSVIREEIGQAKDVYDIGNFDVIIYSYDKKAVIKEGTKINTVVENGANMDITSSNKGRYMWPKVTGNIESYKGRLVATELNIWRRSGGLASSYPNNPSSTDKETVYLNIGSGGKLRSKYDNHLFTLNDNGTLTLEIDTTLYNPDDYEREYLSYSFNLMYVKNEYNIILARIGRAFLSSENSTANAEGIVLFYYKAKIEEMSGKAVLEIDSRLKKIMKENQMIISNGELVNVDGNSLISAENYKYLVKKTGTSPFDGLNVLINKNRLNAKISEDLNVTIEKMKIPDIFNIKSEMNPNTWNMRYLLRVDNYYLISESSWDGIYLKDILKEIAINIYNAARDIKIYLAGMNGAAVIKYGWEDFSENREHHTTGTLDLSALKKEESVQFGKDNINVPGLVLNGELYDLRSIDNSITNIATKVKVEKLSSDGSILETKESSSQTTDIIFDYNTFRIDSNGNLTIIKNEFNGDAIKYRITPCYNNVELGSLTLDITNGKESTFGIYGDNTFDFGKLVPGRDSILSGVMHITNSGDERIIKVEVDKTGEMTKTNGSTPIPLEIAAANEKLPEKDKNNVVIRSHMVVKAKPPKEAESGEYKGQFQVIITVDR